MDGKDLERIDRDQHIWELRKAGYTYAAIGEMVELTNERVRQIVNERFYATVQRINDMRQLQTSDMLGYLNALRADAELGDKVAISASIRVWERLSKLYGLDAQPYQTDHGGDFREEWNKIWTGNQ